MSLEIVPLERAMVPVAAQVLASAFHDDPLLTYLIPNPKVRTRCLPHLMEANLRLTLPYSASWVLLKHDRALGCIAAVPPGGYPYPLARELLFNWRVFWNPNPWTPPLMRFLRVLSYSTLWTRMHFKESHWYVYILGVHAHDRGQGHGKRLMKHVMQLADRDRQPIYLETQTENNLPFYKNLGFTVTESHRPREDGPPTWGLFRHFSAT